MSLPEEEISPVDRACIERLLSDFGWHADRGAGTALAGLFVPDGVLRNGPQTLAGRDAIARDCTARAAAPERQTRHLWSNLRLASFDGTALATTAIQMTFETRAEQPPQLRISDLADVFHRDAAGAWHFASRQIERRMTLPLPAAPSTPSALPTTPATTPIPSDASRDPA